MIFSARRVVASARAVVASVALMVGVAGCAGREPLTAVPPASTGEPPVILSSQLDPRDEVLYHVFFRSFADSNGDRIGDLKGMTARLPYLKELGVTALLLTPIQPSPFYHNYFATDFKGIEPAYGTRADYVELLRQAHAMGLRVYLDLELQYVAQGHPWLAQANHPFILRRKDGTPEPFINQPTWEGYDGRWHGIAMITLDQPMTAAEMADAFRFWADPHGDGSGRDGADGIRIDHMMDDLDNKGLVKDLFAKLWRPVFHELRMLRGPDFRVIAEQADWGYGERWLAANGGNADWVFAFPLRGALLSLDKTQIAQAVRETVAHTPAGKHQVVFVENHDTDRSASLLTTLPRQKALAAISLFVADVPLLYYGQEIGMRGITRKGTLSDGAHVPLREAMRWTRSLSDPGSATWYTDVPAPRFNSSNDGISVEEQSTDRSSLLATYRSLLAARAGSAVWRRGALDPDSCPTLARMLCMTRTLHGDTLTLKVDLQSWVYGFERRVAP